MTPFTVLQEDKDHVIMLINYFTEKGEDEKPQPKREKNNDKTLARVRVNDKTATGGWW